MPRKDAFHESVKKALLKEGWLIAYDPLFIPSEGGINFFIDLGLERLIGAKKESQNIAVEVKSFNETTPYYNFYEILGQFLMYEMALKEQTDDWKLYIAISISGYTKLKNAPIFFKAIQKFHLNFIIFEPITETIFQWRN